MPDKSNLVKGQFRPPAPPVSARIDADVLQEVEHREDGPWLVVYVSGRKVGEVPIEPGTEPKLKRAKVLDFPHTAPSDIVPFDVTSPP